MKAYFALTPWQSTRRLFLDVSLFSDATQLSFQPSGFRVLINLNAVA